MNAPETTQEFHKAVLVSHPMFESIDAAELEDILAHARTTFHEKGKLLFLQGDRADYCYMVLSGWVKVFRETLDGDEAVIDVINQGNLLGENAIFDADRYNFSAEIVSSTTMLAFPMKLLKDKVENNSKIALAMLNWMGNQRRRQAREIEGLTLQTASQRLGCFLLRLCRADSDSVTLHLPYDKSLIAARLGMKSETFSRALGKLKKDTGIVVKGPSIEIPDVIELSGYTCNACSNEFPCEDIRKHSA